MQVASARQLRNSVLDEFAASKKDTVEWPAALCMVWGRAAQCNPAMSEGWISHCCAAECQTGAF